MQHYAPRRCAKCDGSIIHTILPEKQAPNDASSTFCERCDTTTNDATQTTINEKPDAKYCEYCGNTIVPLNPFGVGRPAKFCSDSCRSGAWKMKKRREQIAPQKRAELSTIDPNSSEVQQALFNAGQFALEELEKQRERAERATKAPKRKPGRPKGSRNKRKE